MPARARGPAVDVGDEGLGFRRVLGMVVMMVVDDEDDGGDHDGG